MPTRWERALELCELALPFGFVGHEGAVVSQRRIAFAELTLLGARSGRRRDWEAWLGRFHGSALYQSGAARCGDVAYFLADLGNFGKPALRYATFAGQAPLGSMELASELRGDCARCQGLCCVSLAFDRSEWFAFDKAAGEPCRHLSASNRCRQHARLEAAGHGGCASYDCYGAGQRVTEELFPGLAWRRVPEQQRALFAAFLRLRDVHELRLLLHEAARLPLPRAARAEGQLLLGQLEPARGLSAADLAALDVEALQRAVHAYLRGLRPLVEGSLPPRRRLALLY